jgi:hypothetical protein
MYADFIAMTSSTGGAAAMILAAVDGFAAWSAVPGFTGTRKVSYTILEYTDATRTTILRAEAGIGDITLTTLSLARTKLLWTWSGTTYVTVAPTALTFGTTAANIRVYCSPLVAAAPWAAPGVAITGLADTTGYPPLNMQVAAATYTFTSGREIYVPWFNGAMGEVTGAALIVTTAVASTGVKAAIYDIAPTGGPGNKVVDVASTTPFSTATTGTKSATLTKWLSPGWHYYALIANGAIVVRAASVLIPGPQGTNLGQGMIFFDVTGSYSTGLPAVATTSLSLSGAANPPVLFVKTRG